VSHDLTECTTFGGPYRGSTAIAAQIIRSGAGNDATLLTQVADHIGGYFAGQNARRGARPAPIWPARHNR
jgi:hypothetical protein